MRNKVFKTLEKINDNESGIIETLMFLGFLYFIASFIVRA